MIVFGSFLRHLIYGGRRLKCGSDMRLVSASPQTLNSEIRNISPQHSNKNVQSGHKRLKKVFAAQVKRCICSFSLENDLILVFGQIGNDPLWFGAKTAAQITVQPGFKMIRGDMLWQYYVCKLRGRIRFQ